MILTAQDVSDLERIESEIEQDQTSFFRMAQNLVTIRDRKLYLRDYKTFESYCQTRWGWSRQWVNQQIRSAAIVKGLPEKTVETLVSKVVSPLTESVARAVAAVPKEKRAAVIEHAAAKSEPVTARSISESAKTVQKPKVTSEPVEPPKRRDETGWIIPENRIALFDRKPNIERVLDKLADVRGFVRRMQESNDILYREVDPNGMLVEFDKLYAELKRAIPYAVCPYCQGIKAEHCTTCRQRGVISKYLWDTAVPEELKEIRRKTLEEE